ncbi:membrane protein FxsA [Geothermobacter hydrogeniphilus]|uniref:Membrane protein FxsA n=1 Tax=Geothermobacter hydrogeniphilus TaxID=1969733 RepID=A0A2K2H8L1_9BACT|nr:FxsA family protein [Geothermobacter hydrogeniphilus]PNU19563.1 membrane protein FxsA [Geothermobacter hydrogeniphilus]
MFITLIVIFILVPILEVYTLIQAGALIGVGPTIALILLTGIAGAWLARSQGLELVQRIQSELAAGRMPTEELIDGAMVLVGGVVLLTPGFWTDLCGFICLVPGTRNLVKKLLRRWFENQRRKGTIQFRRF